ncbi:MAG: hypothetical protein SGARI_000137 [Bacillariaceae sp.]
MSKPPNSAPIQEGCQDFLWTPSGPSAQHWANNNDAIITELTTESQRLRELAEKQQQQQEATDGPLHLASGFRVVSQALHENIIATFGRFVSKEEGAVVAPLDNVTEATALSGNDVPALSGKTPISPTSEADSPERKSEQMERLLEESHPAGDPAMDRKRLGIGYIAGGVAGGLAGLVLAGPAGGLIGIKCGQLGVLEGSFTVGALAGGVAAGQNIGKHLDDKIQESRVLALGEGTQRQVVLLIRPSIQPPDEAWNDIYQEARKAYSGGGGNGIVQRLIPNEANTAKRERYERDLDIVQVEEAELATNDKVLLLVSRILNNKDSLPGHVYRQLLQAFRERVEEDLKEADAEQDKTDEEVTEKCTESALALTEVSTNLLTDSDDDDDENNQTIATTAATKRRQDTHAVIKYITAALLETRPGFGSSTSMTEMTATAVESLVFGELYDLVMAEIEDEKRTLDDDLLIKISDFDRRQQQLEQQDEDDESNGIIMKRSSIYCNAGVSEKALNALQGLPEAHSAVDKLRYCVLFLEAISGHFSGQDKSNITDDADDNIMGADALLPMVCRHILAARLENTNAQVAFLEEFARDEQLLRGREGYALVTLQAALHYLNSSLDFEADIFGQCREEDGEEALEESAVDR